MNKTFYRLFQLPHNHDNLFMHYDRVKDKVDIDDYCCVWADEFSSTSESDLDQCEDLYYVFNCKHPKGFGGHSMSVSDIVEIHRGDEVKRYYCDSFGFKEIVKRG